MSAVQQAEVEFTEDGRRVFEIAGKTLAEFFQDRSHVAIIRGPIGSAKTATAFQKVWAIACEQQPSPQDGLRKTRWGFIRNTYGELEGTTVKDFLEQFPDGQYGTMYYSRPLEYHMAVGDVRAEIVFMALDKPDDIKKLRSTQFTGFFLHEMQYLPKEIFDECESRVGRFPGPLDGRATWDGVLGDMNEPGEDHWLLPMTGEVPYPEGTPLSDQIRWPKDWKYYVQPPALVEVFNADQKTIRGYKINPLAENLKWLKHDYYPNKVRGKDKAWIDSRLMNRISVWVDGKPVFPMFKVETHVAAEPLKPVPGYPIILGKDFGRSPGVVFGQLISNRWYILDELCGYDVDTTEFAPLVKRKLDTRFKGYDFHIWGDPKGADKTQNSTRTSYEIMESFDMRVEAAPCGDNDLVLRLGAVTHVLNGMHDGAPRLVICPENCRALKVAMAGKYHYAKQRTGNGYEEKPKKDKYSNIADALQYLLVGEGEGRTMMGRPAKHSSQPVQTRTKRRSLRRVA